MKTVQAGTDLLKSELETMTKKSIEIQPATCSIRQLMEIELKNERERAKSRDSEIRVLRQKCLDLQRENLSLKTLSNSVSPLTASLLSSENALKTSAGSLKNRIFSKLKKKPISEILPDIAEYWISFLSL